MAYIRSFHDDFRRNDPDAFISKISPGFVGFGTGAHERYIGRNEVMAGLQQDASEVESVEREYKWLSVSQRGTLILFATEYDIYWTVHGNRFHSPARLTGVLERHDGRLRSVQSHMSFPAPDQPAGRS